MRQCNFAQSDFHLGLQTSKQNGCARVHSDSTFMQVYVTQARNQRQESKKKKKRYSEIIINKWLKII